MKLFGMSAIPCCVVLMLAPLCGFADFERLSCRASEGESRDLKVGLWSWPAAMDFDGDGDLDLVVSCPCKPYNGTFLFRNPGDSALPLFGKAERIGEGKWSFTRGDSARQGREILLPATRHADFPARLFDGGVRIGDLPDNVHTNRLQANVWREVDFDGDGLKDILVGTDDWEGLSDALWGRGMRENYAPGGRWIGPVNVGNVYFIRNIGAKGGKTAYATPELVRLADGAPLVTEGNPMPMCEDWDGDGDLDLICGCYVNTFTYFENIGTRTAPRYAAGRPVRAADGCLLAMDLAMITPSAIDWDGDGKLDVICGDEDGRVAFLRGIPRPLGEDPVFETPRYFRQEADDLNFGALSTPFGIDWDGDGDWDLLCGNTAGQIAFIENLSAPGEVHPRWAEPKLLEAGGNPIRFRAGPNGSIQGPVERNWGYTCLSAADWDGDGLADLMVNTITGDVVWFRNVGTRTKPALAPAEDVEVEWVGEQPRLGYGWYTPRHKRNPKGLLTQWRTTPVMFDWNGDGLMDLVMLDHEGYLAFFERTRRDGRLALLPPKRVLADKDGRPLRLAPRPAGHSGRRKLAIADVDGDGRPDLLADGVNVDIYLNLGTDGDVTRFADPVQAGQRKLAHHSTAPTVVDFDGDGRFEILAGAEDGYFYYLSEPVRLPQPFEKIALIDSYDFAHCNDIETNEGVDEIIDFALKTGCETMLWRNQGAGNMRHPSAENPTLEDPLERWRTSSATLYGWTRLQSCATNHLAYALASLAQRGVRTGIHHTMEECHWNMFSSLSRWNFDHPQCWSQCRGGQPWPGMCAISHPETVAHRLRLLDEVLAMGGGDTFFFDTFRDGRWSAAFECTPEMRAKWKARFGEEPPENPEDERWLRFVSPYFHDYLRSIRRRLDATGRKIRFLVPISHVRGPDDDGEWKHHAFDWKAFVREGVVDGIVADGIVPDPKDVWGSTRRAYEWVVANRGTAQVYFHCSEYEDKHCGVGTYMRLTGLRKGEVARKLLEIARDVGGAGVILECVDPHLYGPEINAVLREFGDGAKIARPHLAPGTATVPALAVPTPTVRYENPVFSPDGLKIAFQQVRGGRSRIGIREKGNPEIRWIETGPGQAMQPCWTPDGGLVYVYGNYTNTALRSKQLGWPDANYNLYHWKDGVIRRLTDGHWRDLSPAVGPDGTVCFTRCEGALFSDHHWLWKLSLADPARAERIRRTSLSSSSSIVQPSLSPDGKWLLWSEIYGSIWGAWDIRMASASAPMEDRILSSALEVATYPRWAPDSKTVVYSGYRSGDAGWGVWLMDVTTGLRRRLCDGRDADISPDGKRLVYVRPDDTLSARELSAADYPTAANASADGTPDPSKEPPRVLCTAGAATNRTEVPFVGHDFGRDRTVWCSVRFVFNGQNAQQDFLNVSFGPWNNLALRIVTLSGIPFFSTMFDRREWLAVQGLEKLTPGEHVLTGIRGGNRRLYLSVDGGYPISMPLSAQFIPLDGSKNLLLMRNPSEGSSVLSAEFGTGWPASVPRLF